ncbi:MAG: DUF507 family protein [Myxococcales bacterium]|nr:DUF507 family protein [Polyangiaceae bacterium]MDW8249980.1 DUF507 family protein [Myxococcales bacterium]
MRLYSGKVGAIASDSVKELLAAGQIECESPREVEKDIAAVLSNYVKLEQEVLEQARDWQQRRNLPPSELPRLRRAAAEQKGIKIGEDTLDFLLDQVVEMLLHSGNVDEVFAEDHELRRTMGKIFKKHMAADEELEQEIRSKLKHVQEGTSTWEVEYQRMKEEIRRRKGL